MNDRIHVLDSAGSLQREAARRMAKVIQDAVKERGICTLALAGGETPRGLYRLLATEPYKSAVPWEQTHLFFGDERMVPPGDTMSNYGMVATELVAKISIPPENIHRIQGEKPPAEAASGYEIHLASFFQHALFRMDLILLGIGDDGHTASIFPGTLAIDELRRTAVEIFVPVHGNWRVTLTLPVLNRGREIWFLAAGKGKSAIVRTVLSATAPDRNIPASLIRPDGGRLSWFLDADAASAWMA